MTTDKVFDWAHAVNPFMDRLALLHGHLISHRMHECWERDAEEIVTAIGLLAVATHDDWEWEDEEFVTYDKRRERQWNEAWDYLRDNMRKWWC